MTESEIKLLANYLRPKLVFTTAELAEELHMTTDKVNLLRKVGLIEGIKKGNTYIFSRLEVERFLQVYKGADLSNEEHIKHAYLHYSRSKRV